MTPEQIIEKLNKINVHYWFELADSTKGGKRMTLEDRLAETCEEGMLVTGSWINNCVPKKETVGLTIKPNDIYCYTTEDIYELGSTYKEAKRELSDGYVSQLTNTQPFDGEDYWQTDLLD